MYAVPEEFPTSGDVVRAFNELSLRTRTRVARLVIARESATNAVVELHKMVERITAMHPDLPGQAEIRRRGIEPLFDGDPETLTWRHKGGHRAALYCVDGTFVLLVLGSATMRNLAADEVSAAENNFVVELFQHVLGALRPAEVLTGAFDRLVRAHEFTSKTFWIFNNSGVEYLTHEGGEIDFHDASAEDLWEQLSQDAVAGVRQSGRRLNQGAVSAVRTNQFHRASMFAPPGLMRKAPKDGKLIPNPAELPMLLEVVRDLAGPEFTISGTARRLMALVEGGAPRRRGHDGVRTFRGDDYMTRSHAAEQRNRRFVERALKALPDLALGRPVATHSTPVTGKAIFVGARREQVGTQHHHWLVWSVPDLFEELTDEVLFEAVRVAATWRLHRGLPASYFLRELAERERALRRLETLDDRPGTRLSADDKELLGWAGRGGRMVHAMGGDAPGSPRQDLVLAAISKAEEEGGSRLSASVQNSGNQRLFAKMGTWRQGESEFVISSGVHNYAYTFHLRDADLDVTPQLSMRRAWNLRKGLGNNDNVIAAVPIAVLHRGVALAAAQAIDAGVDRLRAKFFASGELDALGGGDRLEQLARGQWLKNRLDSCMDEAAAAVGALLSHERRRAGLRRVERDVASAPGVDAVVRSMPGCDPVDDVLQARLEQAARDAAAREVRARTELERFESIERAGEAQTEGLGGPLNDHEVVLRVLTDLANSSVATPKQCRAWQALFVRFEVLEVNATAIEVSFDLLLPSEGDSQEAVGPIRAVLPVMGERRLGGISQAQAYAEAYCVRGLIVDHSPFQLSGSATGTAAWIGDI